MATNSYVGIDVSKDRLDVAVLGERQERQVENSRDGIARLVEQMQDLQPELIVVEATGGYQRRVGTLSAFYNLLNSTPFCPPRLEPERKGRFQVFFGGKFCYQFYLVMKMENLITTPQAKWLSYGTSAPRCRPCLPRLKKH